MRMKYNIIFIIFFIIGDAFGYECKPVALPFKLSTDKKSAFHNFSKTPRQILVGSLIYNLTENKIIKSNSIKNTIWLFDYLENTEQNADQRAFFKLLRTSADIESTNPKTLNRKEICEIMEKVNGI